jgi:hypothetical protein
VTVSVGNGALEHRRQPKIFSGFGVKFMPRKNLEKKQVPLLIHLPERYIKDLDYLVEIGHYPNRNAAIRMGVRDLLSVEVWWSVHT